MSKRKQATDAKPQSDTCCPVLALALRRSAERTERYGLAKELMFNFKTGKESHTIVVHFRKAKDRKEEFADATYAECSHCPFCGAKLERS